MSNLELLAAKAALNGLSGSKVVLPLDVDKIVTSTNMKNGAYTIAAQPDAPCRLTVNVTAVGAADTMGVVTIVGTLPDGTTVQETVTPVAGESVSTVNEFASVTSATGSGWTIVEGNDTITIGTGAVIPESYYFNAISDRIVSSTNMKVGAYTVAAQPLVPSKITVAVTAGDTADTMGTVTISGFDSDNAPLSETVTPIAGSTVTTSGTFKTILSVVGAGWVIDDEEGTNDTIVVGTAEVSKESDLYISNLLVLADAVVASQEDLDDAIQADLSQFTELPAGSYPVKLESITLTSGEAIAYLAVR